MKMTPPCVLDNAGVNILKNEGSEQELTSAEIQEEVRKYQRYFSQVAEPNLGRVREIQEEIKKGTYLTSEMVQETANRLALRFLRKE